jgi:hypothetical protein
MTYETEHALHSEDMHPIEAERNSDDAATIFAKLFLEQYQYNKRMREKSQKVDDESRGKDI